jgi:hypothetical protein
MIYTTNNVWYIKSLSRYLHIITKMKRVMVMPLIQKKIDYWRVTSDLLKKQEKTDENFKRS